MNIKKTLILLLCTVALVATGIFGTLAYLTDNDSVTNTFTVGQVGISLDEAKVNPDGSLVQNAARVKTNAYHLLPGHTYVKDPTVHIDANSESAYIRMLVEVENIDMLKAALPGTEYYQDGIFLLQNLCDGWDSAVWQYEGYTPATKTVGEGESAKNVQCGVYEFRYATATAKNTAVTDLPALFQTITVPGAVDNTHLAHLAAVKINVTAHAIQADGFEGNADAAWLAFDGQNSNT